MKWKPCETEILRNIYSNSPRKKLLETFPGRSIDAIKLKAGALGLKKNINELIAADLSVLLRETSDAYYWMGFLYADGYFNHDIRRLKLTVQERDIQHLKKFSNFIGCNNIGIYEKENGQKYAEIRVMDRFTFPSIVNKFGLKPRKTYNPPDNLEFLNHNADLFVAFLIGFIDADGYIQRDKRLSHLNEIRIIIKLHSSWKQVLETLTSKLYLLLGYNPSKVIINNQGYAKVGIYRRDVIEFLKQKIIQLKLPAMNRKWCYE